MKLKIKKGDTVMCISGNSKGAVGRVLQVIPDTMMILVEGVNIRSKAVRASQKHPNGGIIKLEIPVHYSNVMLVDKNGKPTRVTTDRSKANDGKKIIKRIAKTTQEEI
ncbi:MAG: 50S ribosomal protein L24 [bacterium]|nr:50S ribosomal protein L24 [bacterium]